MALSLTVAALCSTSGAHPELFGFVPVSSITSPPDADGEVSWSTSGMPVGEGWCSTVYDLGVVSDIFGAPSKVAPDVSGWAFAHVDAPEFGILLVPVRGRGVVQALCWDYGSMPGARIFEGWRLTGSAGSAWLNALADFQREVLHDPPERP